MSVQRKLGIAVAALALGASSPTGASAVMVDAVPVASAVKNGDGSISAKIEVTSTQPKCAEPGLVSRMLGQVANASIDLAPPPGTRFDKNETFLTLSGASFSLTIPATQQFDAFDDATMMDKTFTASQAQLARIKLNYSAAAGAGIVLKVPLGKKKGKKRKKKKKTLLCRLQPTPSEFFPNITL
jgi:hypothetical protein